MVLLLWQILHKIAVSASLIERRISKRFPQSLQIYSYIGIISPDSIQVNFNSPQDKGQY